MQTISEMAASYSKPVVDFCTEQVQRHLPELAANTEKVFQGSTNGSMNAMALGTLAGTVLLGRTCCCSRMSASQRLTNIALSGFLFAAVGYEIYANGVNAGVFGKL